MSRLKLWTITLCLSALLLPTVGFARYVKIDNQSDYAVYLSQYDKSDGLCPPLWATLVRKKSQSECLLPPSNGNFFIYQELIYDKQQTFKTVCRKICAIPKPTNDQKMLVIAVTGSYKNARCATSFVEPDPSCPTD